LRKLPCIALASAFGLLSAVSSAVPVAAQEARPACVGAEGYSAAFDGRRTFLWHPDALEHLKAGKDSDPRIKTAYEDLIARADEAMTHMLYTVVDKRTIPYSGDRHDYMSTVANWFADPKKPGGPYIRGQGSNPERFSDKYDIMDLENMSADVETLALAYYFSENPRYATRAASLVRTWFLTPASRMNPNMEFAQTVIGREKGRPDGVLETARIQRVIEGVGLIAPSGKLTADETRALEQWFSDYVDWMRTSKHGKGASVAKGYNSLWYDAQLAHFALFARRADVAKATVEAFPAARFPDQFSPEGQMPLEIGRPRSLYFSIYALSAAYNVAEIGQCVGVDLWDVEQDGRSLKRATDFLNKYRGKLDSWPYPETNKGAAELNILLNRANRHWGTAYGVSPRARLVAYMKAR